MPTPQNAILKQLLAAVRKRHGLKENVKMSSGLISALADLSHRQSLVKPRAPPIDQPVRKKSKRKRERMRGVAPFLLFPLTKRKTRVKC